LAVILTGWMVEVFSVYGSITGTGYPLGGFDKGQAGWSRGRPRFPLVAAAMTVGSTLFTTADAALGTVLGVVRPPLPITEHPLF
jgi:hypothetical protein